jgi:hypothetical protein
MLVKAHDYKDDFAISHEPPNTASEPVEKTS